MTEQLQRALLHDVIDYLSDTPDPQDGGDAEAHDLVRRCRAALANARLLSSAPRMLEVLEEMAIDDLAGLYETEYDGQMLPFCVYCDYSEDRPHHDCDCPIVEARALIVEARLEAQS